MLTGNISDIGSWKCGKGRALTHIPTNFIILFIKKSSRYYNKFEGIEK